jgi:anthranilate synthase component 2
MLILIDNYDSFTYNLVHFLGELGAQSLVIRNDKVTAEDVIAQRPKAIVLSPGPCTPNEAGVCLDLIAKAGATIPLLGVCLGHQSIGQSYGGRVIRAPVPMHGKLSRIRHADKGVFKGLPQDFEITRYHSLIVERESLPDCLEITAETDDGLIMGLQHKQHPVHGVQFHPESIASQYGHALLANFLEAAGLSPKRSAIPSPRAKSAA